MPASVALIVSAVVSVESSGVRECHIWLVTFFVKKVRRRSPTRNPSAPAASESVGAHAALALDALRRMIAMLPTCLQGCRHRGVRRERLFCFGKARPCQLSYRFALALFLCRCGDHVGPLARLADRRLLLRESRRWFGRMHDLRRSDRSSPARGQPRCRFGLDCKRRIRIQHHERRHARGRYVRGRHLGQRRACRHGGRHGRAGPGLRRRRRYGKPSPI